HLGAPPQPSSTSLSRPAPQCSYPSLHGGFAVNGRFLRCPHEEMIQQHIEAVELLHTVKSRTAIRVALGGLFWARLQFGVGQHKPADQRALQTAERFEPQR